MMQHINKRSFRILHDWRITHSRRLSGDICVDAKRKIASLARHPAPIPCDYYLHEYLHCALRAWQRLKSDTRTSHYEEERLIQDICRAKLKQGEQMKCEGCEKPIKGRAYYTKDDVRLCKKCAVELAKAQVDKCGRKR